MNVFNPNNLRNKQRFPVAILMGVSTSVICAIVIGMITSGTGWYYSLLYIGAAWLIGNAIKYFGRGVDTKFSILSGVCFLLCVFLSDYFSLMHTLSIFSLEYIPYSFEYTFRSLLDVSTGGLIHTIMVGYSTYLAYYMAKII